MLIRIDGQLADLNTHDKANRNNKFVGAKLKKEMTDLVAWQVKGKPKVTRPCTIGYTWYYSGKFDFDNLRFACKYVNDGLVKAGVLPNDNQKWVLGFDYDVFIKAAKGKEGVVVEINEYDL